MPKVIGKAMKLTKLILIPSAIVAPSSQATPTTSEPITNGVARPRRKMRITVATTPRNASPEASGPSRCIDAMMSDVSGGPPATRAGRPPSATGASATSRSARTKVAMVLPRHQRLAGLG